MELERWDYVKIVVGGFLVLNAANQLYRIFAFGEERYLMFIFFTGVSLYLLKDVYKKVVESEKGQDNNFVEPNETYQQNTGRGQNRNNNRR